MSTIMHVNNPSVDVFMPTFNSEMYLVEAITSIINQSYENFNLNIMDGGSIDLTIDIANKMSARDRRIRVHDMPSTGPAERFNRLIETSQADFIVVAHSDDVSAPDRFQKQLDFMISNGLLLSGSAVHYWKHEKHNPEANQYSAYRTYPKWNEGLQSEIVLWWCFSTPTAIFDLRQLRSLSIRADTRFKAGADWLLFWNCVRNGRTDNLNEPLVSYRVHSQSDGATSTAVISHETRAIRTMMAEELGFWSELSEYLREVYLGLTIEEGRVNYFNPKHDYGALFEKLRQWGEGSDRCPINWSETLDGYEHKIIEAVESMRVHSTTDNSSDREVSVSDLVQRLTQMVGERDKIITKLSQQGEQTVSNFEEMIGLRDIRIAFLEQETLRLTKTADDNDQLNTKRDLRIFRFARHLFRLPGKRS